MLPYWHTTVNPRGGYRVYDPGDRSWRTQIKSMLKGENDRSRNESLRGLISQARLLWVFSHAHISGYSTSQHDYLQAAAHGYSYLIETMLEGVYFAVISNFISTATSTNAVLFIDSDKDGLPDSWELAHGLNPTNKNDATLDADGDSLSNMLVRFMRLCSKDFMTRLTAAGSNTANKTSRH